MAQVHPYKFTTSILSLAQENGAQLIHGLCTSLNPTSINYTADESGENKSLKADTIIITTGPWTPTLLPSIPISTARAHSIVLEPSTQLPPQAIFFTYQSSPSHRRPSQEIHPELYSRPSSVYICGPTDSTHPLPSHARDVKTLDTQTAALETFAKEISTQLEHGTVVAKQACYLPFHERGFPAIGWYQRAQKGRGSGVFVAAGHGVWGISLAPGTGRVVAEMVVGGSSGRGEGYDVTKLAP
jgi:glycine/D-amino acid oxidase-like deaminating enzyme